MPESLSDSGPVAASIPADAPASSSPDVPDNPVRVRPAPDPVRYGDWEKNGRCIDF